MRRQHDTPNGLTEFMIAEAIELLRERGVAEVSLNFAAFARLIREPRRARSSGRSARLIALGDTWFQIERLYRFNAKFFPRWEPRYFMYERRFGLPRAGIAALWLEGQLPKPKLRRRHPAAIWPVPARAPRAAEHRVDGLLAVEREPDAEERERDLDERRLERGLELLAATVREDVVEPRVAEEQRRRDGGGRRRPLARAARWLQPRRAERRGERDVEADPGDVPVVARVPRRQAVREHERPRDEHDRSDHEHWCDPAKPEQDLAA